MAEGRSISPPQREFTMNVGHKRALSPEALESGLETASARLVRSRISDESVGTTSCTATAPAKNSSVHHNVHCELQASPSQSAAVHGGPRTGVQSDCSDGEPAGECGVEPAATPRGPVSKPCYLCFFSDEPACVHYSKFIMNESARTSRQQIAEQVHVDICDREKKAGRSPPDGATVVDIERHIALHMLHPSIKVPELIRELDGVRHLLRGSITNVCPETGGSVIDTGNVALYLRVVRELQQVYKMGDSAKLSLGGTWSGTVLAVDL